MQSDPLQVRGSPWLRGTGGPALRNANEAPRLSWRGCEVRSLPQDSPAWEPGSRLTKGANEGRGEPSHLLLCVPSSPGVLRREPGDRAHPGEGFLPQPEDSEHRTRRAKASERRKHPSSVTTRVSEVSAHGWRGDRRCASGVGGWGGVLHSNGGAVGTQTADLAGMLRGYSGRIRTFLALPCSPDTGRHWHSDNLRGRKASWMKA